jgi:hypothetical protein
VSDVRDLGPYEDLRRALDARADAVWPSRDALFRVRASVRRRRRRRRGAIGSCALVVTTVAIASVGGTLRESPGVHRSAAASPSGPARAGIQNPVTLRSQYGIVGTTKGAANALPRQGGGATNAGLGVTIPSDAASTSVAPGHTTVAVVTTKRQVVVESVSGSAMTVLGRTKSGAQLSWSAGGTALFAFVGKHWVSVPSAVGTQNSREHVRALRVPRVRGGPSFISMSPGKDIVVLFGVTKERDAARPHAYIGRFNGADVTHVRHIRVPAAAVRGPLGWLGDNAFLVAAGPGKAWIVRVHGPHVAVRASIPDPCSSTAAPSPCVSHGPRLLGTDADGALLFWVVRADSATPPGDTAPGSTTDPADVSRSAVAVYFSTWLDGSHATRLTGSAGTYGPPLAAR